MLCIHGLLGFMLLGAILVGRGAASRQALDSRGNTCAQYTRATLLGTYTYTLLPSTSLDISCIAGGYHSVYYCTRTLLHSPSLSSS